MIFGVLAHAHDWKPSRASGTGRITESLYSCAHKTLDLLEPDTPELCHPRYLIDVVCVANAATFVYGKTLFVRPIPPDEHLQAQFEDYAATIGEDYECVATIYRSYEDGNIDGFNVLGEPLVALVSYLTQRLAYEDVSLRPLADYFEMIHTAGSIGKIIEWSPGIFSDEVLSQLSAGRYDAQAWSKWDRDFY